MPGLFILSVKHGKHRVVSATLRQIVPSPTWAVGSYCLSRICFGVYEHDRWCWYRAKAKLRDVYVNIKYVPIFQILTAGEMTPHIDYHVFRYFIMLGHFSIESHLLCIRQQFIYCKLPQLFHCNSSFISLNMVCTRLVMIHHISEWSDIGNHILHRKTQSSETILNKAICHYIDLEPYIHILKVHLLTLWESLKNSKIFYVLFSSLILISAFSYGHIQACIHRHHHVWMEVLTLVTLV